MISTTKQRFLLLGLVLLVLTALTVSVCLGSTSLSLFRVLTALTGLGQSSSQAADQMVVWQIRLPRAMAAFLVGSALGISGAALQGLLRNPLAEPGVLGVSACASLGATSVLFFGLWAVHPMILPLAAVIGALSATALLAHLGNKVRSMVTLILIGVGLSSFAGALMALLMNLSPNPFTLADLVNWMLGTVANRSWNDVLFALPFMAFGWLLLLLVRNSLSALTLGEEAATGVGLNLVKTRRLVILGTGLCTGAAVALAGAIGFVGIVAPHLVRPWVNYRAGAVLLPSALVGGLLLVLADLLVRVVATSSELKLGVVAALLGAPAFVWIASQRGMRRD